MLVILVYNSVIVHPVVYSVTSCMFVDMTGKCVGGGLLRNKAGSGGGRLYALFVSRFDARCLAADFLDVHTFRVAGTWMLSSHTVGVGAGGSLHPCTARCTAGLGAASWA